MTELKAIDGKLYVSAIFDCFGLAVLGLAMDTNMKVALLDSDTGTMQIANAVDVKISV